VLVFGKDKNKGIRMRGLKPIIVDLDKDYNEKELLRHDQYCEDSTLANLLSGFDFPEFPVPMGVLRQVENSTYGEIIEQQIKTQIEKKGVGNFAELLRGNQVWSY
jgi:2-oxoglutarate ferredoxin oxidoreductase subunit beta